MVKSEGEQRESDGVVVPLIGVMNAPGGKGPDFDRAGGEGKRQGMSGVSCSNNPSGPSRSADPVVPDGGSVPVGFPGGSGSSPVLVVPRVGKVRELQHRLWAAAKQSEGRRFHALYDRIYRGDVLVAAWERVRKNGGAAGVDRITLAAVEEFGVARMLGELQEELRSGLYRPAPAWRVDIPKPDCGKTVRTD
jgi:RNA-directed DNA polymerase